MFEDPAVVPGDQTVRRIRVEFLEMPGLRLTEAQARRLWGLDERTCGELLESLITDRFLYRRNDGMYLRERRRFPRLEPVDAGRVPGPVASRLAK